MAPPPFSRFGASPFFPDLNEFVSIAFLFEGSLEVQRLTIWTVEKQTRDEKSSQKKEDQHASRVTRKKIRMRQLLGKSRITVFFQCSLFLMFEKQAR